MKKPALKHDMFCAVNSTCKSSVVVESSTQRCLNAASESTRVIAALLNCFYMKVNKVKPNAIEIKP
jgi:hypothetical protein